MSLLRADTVFATSAPGARTATVRTRAPAACPAVLCAIAISFAPFLISTAICNVAVGTEGQHRAEYPFSRCAKTTREWALLPTSKSVGLSSERRTGATVLVYLGGKFASRRLIDSTGPRAAAWSRWGVQNNTRAIEGTSSEQITCGVEPSGRVQSHQ